MFIRLSIAGSAGCLSSQPREGHCRAHAFTLVELMVVIVLLGILTAMIIPEMKGTFEDALLRSTSRELLNALSLASSRAISLNQLHRLRLDRVAGRFLLETRSRKGGRQPEFKPVSDLVGAQGELDPRITVRIRQAAGGLPQGREAEGDALLPAAEPGASANASDQVIAFYPDGTADAAELVLRDRAGFQLVLKINPITARVRILELARGQETGQ